MKLPKLADAVDGRTYVGKWENVEAFAADAKHCTLNRHPRGSDSSTDELKYNHAEFSWTLGHGFDKVVDLATNGWAETAERIRDTVVPVVSKVTAQIEVDKFEHTDDGSIASGFDVAAVATGDPCYWLQHKPELADGKGTRVIRIGSSFMASWSVDADKMVKRGIVAAAIAYCLEAAGFMVEVEAASSVSSGGKRCLFWVAMKGVGQMMDLNRIAVGLAHPGMLRRLHFAICEGDERLASAGMGSGGYGMCDEPTETEKQQHKVDIWIGNDVLRLTDEQLVPYILDKLKAQGVKIRG